LPKDPDLDNSITLSKDILIEIIIMIEDHSEIEVVIETEVVIEEDLEPLKNIVLPEKVEDLEVEVVKKKKKRKNIKNILPEVNLNDNCEKK